MSAAYACSHTCSHASTHNARTHSTHTHTDTNTHTRTCTHAHTRASIWAILICFLPLALDTSSADEMSADSDVLLLLFFACAPHNQRQPVRVRCTGYPDGITLAHSRETEGRMHPSRRVELLEERLCARISPCECCSASINARKMGQSVQASCHRAGIERGREGEIPPCVFEPAMMFFTDASSFLPSSRTLVISVAAFRTSDLGIDTVCTFTCAWAAEKPL